MELILVMIRKLVLRVFYLSPLTSHFVHGTRMHSSRMRTGRSLTVYCSLLPGGCLFRGCLLRGVSGPGGCLVRGVSGLGGVCSQGGLVWGVCSQGDVCSGGMSAPREGVVSQHALRQTPSPVDRITDACKNITLAQLPCGR